MKKTLLTIIITLLVTAGVILLAHAIWGEGECIFGNDEDEKECVEKKDKSCCDKEKTYKEDCDEKSKGHDHAVMMEGLAEARADFESQLSDEEKATISSIKEKMGDVNHEELCPEGEKKFMEEHKADFDAIRAIASSHSAYLDELYTNSHKDMKGECKEHKEAGKEEKAEAAEDGETAKMGAEKCPEASKCKEATEKCKGEVNKEAEKKCEEEVKKECEEKEKECKDKMEQCQKECMDTFKIHFLLLDF